MIKKLKEVKNRITGIGSLPFTDVNVGIEIISSYFKELPYWPQFPKLNFYETMITQVVEGFPCLKVDEEKRTIIFKFSEEEIYKFYEDYEKQNLEFFKFSEKFASGFYSILKKEFKSNFIKGQIVGPITFLSSIKDENGKALIYNDFMEDIYIKSLTIKGIWQARKFKGKNKIPVIFYDEPVMASYGSSFFPVSEEKIVHLINSLIEELRKKEDLIIGVHCCGNTNWNIFLKSNIDILSFDSYNYGEKFLIYFEDIKEFIKRGKFIAWGVVPVGKDFDDRINFEELRGIFDNILNFMEGKGLKKEEILENSLFTPSCGLGFTSEKYVNRIFDLLLKFSEYYF